MSTHTRTTGALLLSTVTLTACVPMRSAEPVLTHQRKAIVRLAAVQRADALLLRTQSEGHLAIQRALLLGSIHRSFIARGYLSSGTEADAGALRADIADPTVSNALTDDVRAGRLSADDAVLLLTDYALAARMTTDRAPRDAILARLGAVRRFDEASAELLGALDGRAADARALADEALASSDALLSASRADFSLDAPGDAAARVLWERLVLSRIDDPADRAAAAELLTDLLATRSPTP